MNPKGYIVKINVMCMSMCLKARHVIVYIIS